VNEDFVQKTIDAIINNPFFQIHLLTIELLTIKI